MRWLFPVALTLMVAPWCVAGEAKIVPQEYLNQIIDDDPNPLPRYMTPAEKRLPLLEVPFVGTPPSGSVLCPAEYEFNQGIFVRWGSYNSILTAMIVPITTGDPEAIVYILVSGVTQQNSATSILTEAGANMHQVEFITYRSDTVWIRDYGPRFIFEDLSRAIVDHTYNRPRPNDNSFNDYLSSLFGELQYDIPLTHGGGNFHVFTNGDAFMTELILDENPGISEYAVEGYYADYQNVDLTMYPAFPSSFDSTQHIDMWMLPVADYKVIVGEYSKSSGAPYTITENATADLESKGYTVYRTPGWSAYGTHYTYTNAVILNDLVLIPKFGGSYTSEDAQAKAVFEHAFPPESQIVQVDCSDIIGAAGALHCIVMHVPGYTSAMRVVPGSGFTTSGAVGGPFNPVSIVYTLKNTTSDAAIDYLVTKTAPWLTVTNDCGTILAESSVQVTISINSDANALNPGVYEDMVNFVNLMDHDGDTSRSIELAVGVVEPIYVFNMDIDPDWSIQGEWEFGQPTGQGGNHGNPDPGSGATGNNVYGINLNGDYALSSHEPHYLITKAIDCSKLRKVSLHFQRWLNCDYEPYVIETIDISTDRLDWSRLWSNGGSQITDSVWTSQVLDISSIADKNTSVYIRWGHEVSQGYVWDYSGWNIDDVEIWGIESSVR